MGITHSTQGHHSMDSTRKQVAIQLNQGPMIILALLQHVQLVKFVHQDHLLQTLQFLLAI